MWNQQFYILDAHAQLLPQGVAGELYIGGVGVAKGYWNDEERTKKSFIHHPELGYLYKTGDLGCYGENGLIEFLGRADHQVKIRGYRIELEEIEAVIKKLEDLKEVIVQVKKNSAQEDVLVAYYVSQQDADLNQIKEKIRNCLPSYMVPDIYIRLGALPLSANGKVDYKNLPSISNVSLAKTIQYLPETKEERLLSEIWRAVLTQDLIDIDDNFFDLGGHSLSALQCVTRLKAYGIEIPIRFIFSNPTIRSLAKMIVYNTNHSVSLNSSSSVKNEVYFPLTSAQKRIWFISNLVDDKPLYNITFAFKFTEQLNLEKLDKAFNDLIKKHASFRLSFSKDLEVMQKINEEVSFKVNLIKINDKPCTIEELVSKHNNTIFNLSLAPLMRVRLLKSSHENILIITVHHLIFDGCSMNLMMKDLNGFYYNEKLNTENMTIDYSSYAIDEEKTFLESDLSYWKNLLGSGREELFHLPIMHSRPAASSFNGKTHYFHYQDRSKHLSSLAKRNHASVSTVLLTALFSLLKQYGHVGALNIGMPASMRNESKLEDIIGCFVNTLIVRMQADESTDFEELVSTVQKQIFESLEHKNFSYEKLINELNIERNADHNPLFQILFSYQKAESDTNKLFDSYFEEIPTAYQTAKFDLTLFAFDQHNGNILFSFEYNTDLFDEVLIKKLADHYCNLLKFISTQSACIAQLEFLSVEEKELQTVSWNSTSKLLDNQCYLYEPFEKSAAQYPDKKAVISARGSISYQELNCKANRIAHKLRDLGCQPNELIAVVMEKGWEEACAALAIMKAGSAYLPISADFPHQRIAQLLEQGKVRLVLTQSDYINSIPWENHIQAFSLNHDAAWAGYADNNLKPIQQLSDLAYVIFTSGSTGIPKGVMLNHLSVMNTIADINTRFQVTLNDTILGLSALNFDLSVYDLFGVLGVGGTLVLPAEVDRKDPSVWLSLIAQHKVTLWNTVPALMQMLSDYALVQNEEHVLKTIRLTLLSGDWIPVSLPSQIKKLCGSNTEVISLGGATEGSIWSVLYAIDTVDSYWRNIPYGRPMWNQEMYVLNEQKKLQAVGVPGELYIGGLGVAKGYWNDPIRTKKSFIHHPDLGYLYRTGDTGRYTDTGVIEFLGRIDQQVKIRGYRIELEEVESALLRFPNIKNAVAVVAGDENKKQLAAYFTSFSKIDLNNLKNYLSEKLPSYMMPEAFIPIEAMPLSANGKIDIKALPKVNFENNRSITYQNPETQVERGLAEVWASLLKINKIGKNDNFFELGGNSLSSTQLLITIKKRFLVDLPLRIIFQSRTLKELAFQIEKLLSMRKKEEIGELCYI